jgi:hypothetical protein
VAGLRTTIEKEIALTESPEKAAEIHQAYERGGYKAVSQKRLEFLEARSREMYTSPIDLAFQYAFLNDKEQTLKSLEDSFRGRSPGMAFLQNEPLELDRSRFELRHKGDNSRLVGI